MVDFSSGFVLVSSFDFGVVVAFALRVDFFFSYELAFNFAIKIREDSVVNRLSSYCRDMFS